MTKISLVAAAALLISGGAAFAGSDHYGSDFVYQPTSSLSTSIDHTFTASIVHTGRKPVRPLFDPEPGQGIWGH
ncbi:DUF680 domain-containing protein [Mesorhizobium sp. B2-4-15]|uniref:DUF680 domain-containing protein n=1 Tax=Mesorhizobium sp. B2-4-15 TaxID=2589934 RepID=UPI001151CB18|nr:DUF680 domain-containing protein [Mesorhizobium sp. B2-4-15]TPK66927.1 DUF680 domain-containing protein [Mesorhizobium sp. B2-4-15]